MRAERLKTALVAAVLFAVNCYVVRDLFFAGFIAQMGSIEAAHIAMSRYVLDHWWDLGWFPLWYGGIPFQNTYPPLLRFVVAIAAKVSGASAAGAYHFVTASFYALGPVTLFWLAWRLSRWRAFSFAAALLYSVFSPSALLSPAILKDMGSMFHPRRAQILLEYGEGPHIAALALIPLAIVALDTALEKRRPAWYFLAALAVLSVALTNWIGAVSLAVGVLAYLLARRGTTPRDCLVVAGIGVYAYVLAMPWMPPSTIATIRANSEWQGGAFAITAQHLKYLGLGIVGIVLLRSACDLFKASSVVRFALFFTFPLIGIVMASAWFGINIVPQPWRYQLEVEVGLALLAVFAVRPLILRMGRREVALLLAGFLLFCWFQARTFRRAVRYMDRAIDIHGTIECQTAQWFERHMKGQRVLAPGSVGFWLTAFNDTPELEGGFDQGLMNDLLPMALYQIHTGQNSGGHEGEIAELWLKSFGVRAVMVGGPRSREVFKPFVNPQKFAGRFRELWRDGDDVIYEVPARSASPAHVMTRGDLAPRAPAGGLDVDPLRPYVAALDNPAYPAADFRWLAPSRAVIGADLARGQVLSVQVSHHPGWHARVNGRSCRVEKDHLGQLVIDPESAGPSTVEIIYDGGTEMLAARILSWSALLGGIFWVVYSRRRSTYSSTDSTGAARTRASSVE